jgi:hypothetical protein
VGPYGAERLARFFDAFTVGFAGASAAAVVAALIALLRFVRRIDRERTDMLARLEHRQNHLLQWVRAVAHKVGVQFPLYDEKDDEHNHWDDGLR